MKSAILKDISISATKIKGRPKGRPECRKIRTLNRLKRRLNGLPLISFSNESYLGFSRKSYGTYTMARDFN